MNIQADKQFEETGKFRLPAEWEPQWGVLLTWPHEYTDWAPYLQDIIDTMAVMAREIALRENVVIVAWNKNLVPMDLQENEHVYITSFPTDDTWARDHGPITLVRSESQGAKGGEQELPRWLDFKFNGWGEKFQADFDNLVPLKLRAFSSFYQYFDIEDHEDFVLEGGSIECDGQGTVFTTSQCLLALHRNQSLTQEEIEQELKCRLRVERIVWLDHGNLLGDDTDGHIDTIVRVAPDNTLVYVGCDDPDDEQYEDFQQLEAQLQSLRTGDDQPYRLLKLPMPAAIYEEDGERLPATYANFLVINGAVLVPVYGQEENDRQAMEVIRQAFPDREMVPIDSRTIIRQHGSVHCLTMQIPAIEESEK